MVGPSEQPREPGPGAEPVEAPRYARSSVLERALGPLLYDDPIAAKSGTADLVGCSKLVPQ